MSKRAFDKVAARLTDAIAIARGKKKPAKLHIPREFDIKAIGGRGRLRKGEPS